MALFSMIENVEEGDLTECDVKVEALLSMVGKITPHHLGIKRCIISDPSSFRIEIVSSVQPEQNDLPVQSSVHCLSTAPQVFTKEFTLVLMWAHWCGVCLLCCLLWLVIVDLTLFLRY